jgi:hypothetical protein
MIGFDDSQELREIVRVQGTPAYLRRNSGILRAAVQKWRWWRLAEETQHMLSGT